MDEVSQIIQIGDIANDCQADFIFQTVSANNSVYFLNKSIAPNPLQYFWYFGDGQTSSDVNPVHLFANSGLYQVCLSTFDQLTNCYNTICKEVKIGSDSAYCFADFSFVADYVSRSVVFTDQSQGNPQNFAWNFGDGQTSAIKNPTHTYTMDSVYLVRQEVSNPGTSCYSVGYKMVWMKASSSTNGLYGGFGFDVDSSGNKANVYPVQFYGAANGVPAKWLWSFGDGEKDSLSINPLHEYQSEGVYNVCLTVSDPVIGQSFTSCNMVDVFSVTKVENYSNVNMNIYPNPTSGVATIEYSVSKSENVSIDVYNLLGNKVQSIVSNSQPQGKHVISWNTSNLPSGVYIIQLQTSEKVITNRIVVSK